MNQIPSGDDVVSKMAKVTLQYLHKNLNSNDLYSFLDIGCGDGRDIEFLSSNMENITFRGIDSLIQAIQSANANNFKKNNVIFECLDWNKLDNTQFDIISLSRVYHFFKIGDRKRLIVKLNEILKPDGFFFLTTLSENDHQYYGIGNPIENDPNSFQSEFFLHFCSEQQLRKDFDYLQIIKLEEYPHKNFAEDLKYHTMWMLVARK